MHAQKKLGLSHKKAQDAQKGEQFLLCFLCSFVATARQRALTRA